MQKGGFDMNKQSSEGRFLQQLEEFVRIKNKIELDKETIVSIEKKLINEHLTSHVKEVHEGIPEKTYIYHAFISYRHIDIDWENAFKIYEYLTGLNFKIAIDEVDFRPEYQSDEDIERCIKASYFTLSIITPEYFDSDYCKDESVISKSLGQNNAKKHLIPLIYERTEKMPEWMKQINGIDFTNTKPAYVKPIEKLRKRIEEINDYIL
jgi:TIR domain